MQHLNLWAACIQSGQATHRATTTSFMLCLRSIECDHVISELCHKKSCLPGFQPGPTQPAVQPQKTARDLTFRNQGSREIVAKTKTLLSCAVTVPLFSQCLYFLDPKFQASCHLLWLNSVQPSLSLTCSDTPKTCFLTPRLK